MDTLGFGVTIGCRGYTRLAPRSPLDSPAIGNHLLASLTPKTLDHLRPSMNLVTLALDEVLDAPRESARHVFSPTTAGISVLCVLENGRRVEIGMMGREGMTGMMLCLGVQASAGTTIVQVAGEAISIRAPSFREEFDRNAALRDLAQCRTDSLRARQDHDSRSSPLEGRLV